ncbi:MAG: right-handed parallel beta-helix repeat-containing protein, partial [Lentisphaeria bacterium]
PVTVWCKEGIYPLSAPLILTPEDSLPVTFKAVPGEKPIFDGGILLQNWKKQTLHGKTVFCADVPAAAVRDGQLQQLFVNDHPAQPAAFPKNLRDAYAPLQALSGADDGLFTGNNGFLPKNSDFDPNWYNLKGIRALLMQLWIDSRLPFEQCDRNSGMVHFSKFSRCTMRCETTRYQWLNVQEALTEPGEFYYDDLEKTVSYLPRPGETLENLNAWVPALPILVLLLGDPEKNNFVQWLSFEGLTFRHGGNGSPRPDSANDTGTCGLPRLPNYLMPTSWNNNKPFGGSHQASVHVPGALFLTGAKNCSFRNCTIEQCGGYAITVSGGCSEITLKGNHLQNLGGGGICISGSNAEGSTTTATHHVIVSDNWIHHCGQIYLSAVGILIGHAFGNLVEHNHLHDLYYSGISCGWVWGYGDSRCRENRIGFNLIHDIGKGVLCDMGGIYLLGSQPGTRVYNNRIFNVTCRFYGGWGIYTDEGAGHIVIEENICHDCSREGFHQHYGRENLVRHNISAFNAENGIAVSVGQSRNTGYTFPGQNYTNNYNFLANVIVVHNTPFFRCSLLESLQAKQFFSDMNCFYDTTGKNLQDNFAVGGTLSAGQYSWQSSFSDWQKEGHDLFSIVEDPGFVNLEKRDFRLKENSVLRKRKFPDPEVTIQGAGLSPEQKSHFHGV